MDFIKKIKTFFAEKEELETNEKEEEVKIDRVKSLIEDEITKSEADLNEKEKEFTPFVRESLERLENANNELKIYNLDEKKEHERIKIIVDQNKNNYSALLDILIEKIDKKLEEKIYPSDKVHGIIKEIYEFEKRAKMSYEKATILIGREMENIKKEMRDIFVLFQNFLKQNEELINKKIEFEKALEIMKEFNEKSSILKQSEVEVFNLKEEIKRYGLEKDELLKKIENLKLSEQYNEFLALFSESTEIKHSLNKNAEKIRNSINSKLLESYIYLYMKDNPSNQSPATPLIESEKEKKLLAENYIEDPAGALLSDSDLLLLSFLLEIKEELMKGNFYSDAKKRSRLLSQIILDKNHFEGLKNERALMLKKEKELAERIENMKSSLNMENLDARLSYIEEKLEQTRRFIELKEERTVFLGGERKEILESLERAVSSGAGRRITLTL